MSTPFTQPLSPPELNPGNEKCLPINKFINPDEVSAPALDCIAPPIEQNPAENNNDELLTIIVEIGDGREEAILVYPGDKAEKLAAEFAKKHNLDMKMLDKLTNLIQENIDQAMIDIALEENQKDKPTEDIQKGSDILEQEPQDTIKAPSCTPPESEFEKWQKELEKNLKESNTTLRAPSINENSKKLASNMPLTSLPVYERLHMQALNKQKASKHTSQDPLYGIFF